MELVADLVETERALSDEPAMDAGGQRRLALAAQPLAQERTADDDAERSPRRWR